MNSMKKKIIAIVIIILLLPILFTVSCTKQEEGNVIKIGAILPLTGKLGFLGEPEKVGLDIAQDRYKESLQIIIEDNKSNNKDAIQAVQKLINVDKIDFLITSTTSLSRTVAPFAKDAGIPHIIISSEDSIPKYFDNAMALYININTEQKVLVKYLKENNIDKISVIRVNGDIFAKGIDLIRELSNNEIKIINEKTYDLSTKDFKSILNIIKNDNSEAIYIMDYGFAIPIIIKQLKELKIDKKVITNYTSLLKFTREVSDRVKIVFPGFTLSPDSILKTDFGKKYKEIAGENPRPFLDYVLVYEAVNIIKAYSDNKEHKDFAGFVRGRRFNTLLGDIYINKDGLSDIPMRMATYKNKRLFLIE